ncbi:MAG TPA: hypothetical protein VFY14_15890 [Streptomyces sp.]|nr:hypothetical protein [Streptomyces sp.]
MAHTTAQRRRSAGSQALATGLAVFAAVMLIAFYVFVIWALSVRRQPL